jgi:hypothetical protein
VTAPEPQGYKSGYQQCLDAQKIANVTEYECRVADELAWRLLIEQLRQEEQEQRLRSSI